LLVKIFLLSKRCITIGTTCWCSTATSLRILSFFWVDSYSLTPNCWRKNEL